MAGKGAAILRAAGVLVEEDFMREECDRLNPVFFHYITTKTPYVVMKYAMTADGKIATRTGASKWITGQKARAEVQEIRSRYMGIMAGIGTVLADDPLLNVRIEGKRSPVRIICDSHLRIPLDSRIVQTAEKYRTIVACTNAEKEKVKQLEKSGIEVVRFPDIQGKVDLKELMQWLGAEGIDSILLEGGAVLNDSALRAGIVHKVMAFMAPKIFGGAKAKSPVEGIGAELPSEAVLLKLESVRRIGEDLLLEYGVRGKKSTVKGGD